MKRKPPAIAIVGPTAIGKTELSLRIAEKFSGEIVSVDSMQLYRHMDVGTAKPSAKERARAPHHMIDIADPDENYTVARYVEEATKAIDGIVLKKKVPLLVGGTGLYLRGLLEGLFQLPQVPDSIREKYRKKLSGQDPDALYEMLLQVDPESAARVHPHDRQRLTRALEIFEATGIPWSEHIARHNKKEGALQDVLIIGLTCKREDLYNRINRRVDLMIDQGLLEEVKKLLGMGYGAGLKSMQSIGYRHMVNYLEGKWDWRQAVELLARDTRRYAKRQYTWFRRMPEIVWLHPAQYRDVVPIIKKHFAEKGEGAGSTP